MKRPDDIEPHIGPRTAYPELKKPVVIARRPNPKRVELHDEAIRLLTEEGMPYKAVAERLGVSSDTLFGWYSREPAVEKYRQALRVAAMSRNARALKVLEEQLDSDNQWLAQNAAEKLTRLCGPVATGTDENQGITVRIEGVASLGMPGRAALQEPTGPLALLDAAAAGDPAALLDASHHMDGGEPPVLEIPAQMGARDKADGRGTRRAPGRSMKETKARGKET